MKRWQYNAEFMGKKLSYTLSFDKRSAEVNYNGADYRFNNLNPLTFSDNIISMLKFALKEDVKRNQRKMDTDNA